MNVEAGQWIVECINTQADELTEGWSCGQIDRGWVHGLVGGWKAVKDG